MIVKCPQCWVTLSIQMTGADGGDVILGPVPHCPQNRRRQQESARLIDGRCPTLAQAVQDATKALHERK